MAQVDSGVEKLGLTAFAQGAPDAVSPLSQSALQNYTAEFNEEPGAEQQKNLTLDSSTSGDARHPNPTTPQSNAFAPSRGGTLKKNRSLSRKGSLKRSTSRKEGRPGSVKSLQLDGQEEYTGDHAGEMNSAFFTPVPTNGNPTENLANRFQAWRKVLKDLITYFRDIQKTYEVRSKSLYTLSNVINNTTHPSMFLAKGGIGDATQILQTYHKQSITEGNKAKTIEDEVIVQLTGLRSDLQQKIKEIKSLSGDFKNNVEREAEGTKRAVQELQAALGVAETEQSAFSGKGDPFIVKTAVDRQLRRQIDEENYLHRAFLNLESSGRELESIVVGEIQKAYNAYAGIIKREADEAYEAIENLQAGPLAMPKDREWDAFVANNENFVDPRLPIRRVENITYPGKDDPTASEVRAGMLERKSKYLKSYTPGWYVLSPTHLHEFKSPDRIMSQVPVMSLHLTDQKLGSHSNIDSSSHKFMLKGRQSGGVHRGHAWVFRAESYDTMLAWYEDIKSLTEKKGEERNAFIRQHARSVSAGSNKAQSFSDDGAMEEDEADQVPYSATASQVDQTHAGDTDVERPNPGGRFPSAVNINRDSQVSHSPSSPSSSGDRDIVAAATTLPGSNIPPSGLSEVGAHHTDEGNTPRNFSDPSGTVSSTDPAYVHVGHKPVHQELSTSQEQPSSGASDINKGPHLIHKAAVSSSSPDVVPYGIPTSQGHDNSSTPRSPIPHLGRHDDDHGGWAGTAAAGGGGVALGGVGVAVYKHHQEKKAKAEAQNQLSEDQARQQTPPSEVPLQANQATFQQQGATKPAVTPVTFPTTNTTTPLPHNAAWAGESRSSVLTPDKIQSTDVTPTTSSVDISSTGAGYGLSPVTEQPSPVAVKRPPLESQVSVTTISDLHIPGEFPKKDV